MAEMTGEAHVVALDRLWPGDMAGHSGDLLDIVFGWADFAKLRRLVARQCAAAGLTGTRLDDFVLAVHEIASGGMPFTPRAKKVLELALREALQLGHNYIGTEHILLGVLAEEDGIGGSTLIGLGVTKERVREWLVPVLEQLAQAKRQAS